VVILVELVLLGLREHKEPQVSLVLQVSRELREPLVSQALMELLDFLVLLVAPDLVPQDPPDHQDPLDLEDQEVSLVWMNVLTTMVDVNKAA